MWIDDLSIFGPCPVCPENENENWTAERADIADLSSLSSLSRTKTVLAPLAMDWPPDTWEGRPCCYLPRTPEQLGLAGHIGPDLRGLGIPAEGLPGYLCPFSVNGWRIRVVDGQATMERAHPDARREDGCRDYLKAHATQIATEARLFEEWGAHAHTDRDWTHHSQHDNIDRAHLKQSAIAVRPAGPANTPHTEKKTWQTNRT